MEFDEKLYLEAHPDVADPVSRGHFESGMQHYMVHGKEEGRPMRNPFRSMTRKEKVTHLLDKKGLGLEIGPSHNPIAPKKDGYNVHVLDHLSGADLREKYAGHEEYGKPRQRI